MSVLSLYREAKNFDECPSFLNSFMTEDPYHIETSPLICRAMALIRLLFVEVGFRQIKRKYNTIPRYLGSLTRAQTFVNSHKS